MDFEALKDQWSDIEDRDGIRLSWNSFPSSRMVCTQIMMPFAALFTESYLGSIPAGCPDWCCLYAPEGEA